MCMQCSTSHRLEGVERYLKVGFYPFIDLLGGRIPPSTVSGSRTVGSLPLSRQQPDCEIICRTFKVPRFKAWRWESYPLATMLGGGNSSLCTHAGRWDSFYPLTRYSGGCCCSDRKQKFLSPSSARQGKAVFAVGPTGRTVGRATITVQNYGRSFKVAIPGATSWHTRPTCP